MSTPQASASEPAAKTGRDNWQLDYLFSIGRTSWLIHLAVSVLAFVVLYAGGAGPWSIAWLAGMVLLSLALALLSLAYTQAWLPNTPPERFGIAHSAITAITGLAWGGGALACAVHGDLQLMVLYALVLGGTALGAVSSQHALPRSCLLSIWTSVPPLAFSFVIYDRSASMIAVAAMVMLYGATLTILMRRMHGFLASNVAMAADLALKNSELSATTAELREAHDAKLRFLAQASHDLRQPIHAIGLFVECLKGMRLGADTAEILGSVDQSVNSLSRLCRSLLDLSAIEVGQVTPEPVEFALSDILGDVVRQAQEAAKNRSVRLRLMPTREWVHTDPALLQVIVQNLVSNAIKYAPGTNVLIGVKRRNGRLSVAVIDQGPGIPAELHESIFAEFARMERHRSGHIEGLGLGLSIVRRLAALMDINVRLQSIPNRGSAFWIEDLAPVGPRLSVPSKPARDHQRVLEGLRVLVVDDDHAVRKSTAQVLARWGCSARVTGRLDSLTREIDHTDFVLCDQDLGEDINGLELIKELRAARPEPLDAAIMTGSDSNALRESAAREGVVVLSKPVRPSQLRSLLLASVSRMDQSSPSSDAMPAAAAREGTSSARSTAET